MRITLKKTIEVEVEITGNFTSSTSDVSYLRNGDPGYPGEPASFEIETIMLGGKSDITKQLKEDGFDFESIECECIEDCESYDSDNDSNY
jgi:hypothetical protein